MPKRNSARRLAFDMPTNVGLTYGMYVGPTSYQRYMSKLSYAGATLRQHIGPTMAQRANLVVLEHPMTHTKIQGHRPFGSGEEDFF